MKKTVKTEFKIDDLKAAKIAGSLSNDFYSHKGIFESYSMPDYVLPRNLKEGSNLKNGNHLPRLQGGY